MKLAKRLQIQQIVQKCKKIEQENIPLPNLPNSGKKFSNVEVQCEPEIEHPETDNSSIDSNEEDRNNLIMIENHENEEIQIEPEKDNQLVENDEEPPTGNRNLILRLIGQIIGNLGQPVKNGLTPFFSRARTFVQNFAQTLLFQMTSFISY